MFTVVNSGSVDGINGYPVSVEVDSGRGLPSINIIGLPNTTVRESKERVISALRNSELDLPKGKVVVNLQPSDIPKRGTSFDLAIAIAVAISGANQDSVDSDIVLLGGVSLDGKLTKVKGLLAIVLSVAESGKKRVVVPKSQMQEASMAQGVMIYGAESVLEVFEWCQGNGTLAKCAENNFISQRNQKYDELIVPDYAKRVVEIATAGRFNLLLFGPPGSGKTTVARSIGKLQPPMSFTEAVDVAKIHSAILSDENSIKSERPFRSPHHTITRAGLIGGGAFLSPGEVTLAHNGVLFLDELGEFRTGVLDSMREPMEEKTISISRSGGNRCWPANFQLIAAMNPCRCGFYGSYVKQCECRPHDVEKYRSKLSGPFLDRIDMFYEMVEPSDWKIRKPHGAEKLVESISNARRLLGDDSSKRTLGKSIEILGAKEKSKMEQIRRGLGLSIRSVIRCVSVARVIAALDARIIINQDDLIEATGFRKEIVCNKKT